MSSSEGSHQLAPHPQLVFRNSVGRSECNNDIGITGFRVREARTWRQSARAAVFAVNGQLGHLLINVCALFK
jgi:hypothetical protein